MKADPGSATEAASTRAYVGIGSNLDNPVEQVVRALWALGSLPRSRLVARSGLYRNPAMGSEAQPDYVNAVACVETRLGPRALLERLTELEARQGRVRDGTRWGPRTLDLDLLLHGDARCSASELTLPHPGLAERAFVLVPLLEIAPDLEVPGVGPVAALVARVPRSDLARVDESLIEAPLPPAGAAAPRARAR